MAENPNGPKNPNGENTIIIDMPFCDGGIKLIRTVKGNSTPYEVFKVIMKDAGLDVSIKDLNSRKGGD